MTGFDAADSAVDGLGEVDGSWSDESEFAALDAQIEAEEADGRAAAALAPLPHDHYRKVTVTATFEVPGVIARHVVDH
ncbi:hypothetical protein, partial [Amycolatopsis sp. NPDC000740]|uniref:hypothetical protein n=1 Tax=Amycolatopsis sp. NPDC000740 TaxID=3154269 RepID=UPI00332EF1DC